MEKNERNSINKWTRRSMWAALPVALLANGIAQDVARGGAYYPLGAVILDGAMGLAVLLLAFITVKRHELLRKLPDRKMFLLALGGFIGGILLGDRDAEPHALFRRQQPQGAFPVGRRVQ